LAALLGKPVEEITDAEVDRHVQEIRAAADQQAEEVGHYLDDLAAHLEAIGCPLDEVPTYLRLGEQTLGSLYVLVGQGNPSPGELRRLGLRYALDTRNPVEGDLSRFTFGRESQGWRITEDPAGPPRVLPLPLPGRLVTNFQAVRVLDCVLADPPAIPRLMLAIETILNKVPGPQDGLPGRAKPVFSYQLATGPDAEVRVRLWVNDTEVSLQQWGDIHRLLQVLCCNPTSQFKGRHLKERGIRNASQAVAKIREALEQVWPEASGWLLTGPIRWAEGHAPEERA
jgi:hypothetical protein